MNEMNEAIRVKAEIGLSLLKESILDVLYEIRLESDECVRLKTIREGIGMPKADSGDPKDEWGGSTTRFMLILLRQEGHVEPCQLTEKTKGWRITKTTFQERRTADNQ